MDHLFESAGSLRPAYAAVDWAATPLGPVSSWSPMLTATVRLALKTRFAVTLMWGPDHVLIYNEAYVDMIAEKHPVALGAPARDVFPEIWDTIGPMLRSVTEGGETVWMRDLRLLMNRHGYLEETWFTFSYSAVAGPSGRVEGVIDIAAETTGQVVGNRRLQLLRQLNDKLSDVRHHSELVERALPVLRSAPDDLPEVSLVVASSADLPPPAAGTVEPGPLEIVRTGDEATAHLRLSGVGEEESVLVARLSSHLPLDDAYLGFLRLIGANLAQALDRIRARRADELLASMERAMSETLQQSLLTTPVQPNHLRVAARYRTSIAQAHIGGDWYDTFLLPDGSLAVAVGDVSGHDRAAAAAMAQVRNLLRGIAFSVPSEPGRILTTLGEAMTGLQVDSFATVVLAKIEQDADQAADGRHTLRWSNAGHPPPALLGADGSARLLTTVPERLLGLRGAPERADHVIELEAGATVVFYTDGLVERRGAVVDEGFERLLRALAGRSEMDVEQLCDHLLDEFAGDAEDDIVLTVVRT